MYYFIDVLVMQELVIHLLVIPPSILYKIIHRFPRINFIHE